MIAALPMYDWPEEHAAIDGLWQSIRDALRAEGVDAPDDLSREAGLWDGWLHPDLLLSQACSLPYRQRLHGRVTLLGAFDFALPGCPPGTYHSHIVARVDRTGDIAELARGTFALNGFDSQSGWAAAATQVAGLGIAFTRFLHTGSHRDSARAVAEGEADFACIDAVTFRLITRHDPDIAAALRIVLSTDPTPGLPLICGLGRGPAPILRGLAAALAGLSPELSRRLGLAGFVPLPASAYLSLPTPPAPSQDLPVLQASRARSAPLPAF
jgi:ABC-type phosphate/phosphonate transport system substrate-binding protein